MVEETDSLKAMARIVRLVQGLGEADLRWVIDRLYVLLEQKMPSTKPGPGEEGRRWAAGGVVD